MQEIWLQDLGWDEKLPTELCQRWNSFLQSYSVLEQVRVSRWVSFRPEFRVEHHGFCDARGNSFPSPSNPSPRPRSRPNTPYTSCHRYRFHGLYSPKLLRDGVLIRLAGALIDSGSEATFISERLFKLIKYQASTRQYPLNLKNSERR